MRKGDARRTQLVTLGVRLFGARPYDEVQIEDIAAEAGIAKGLLYHYFGSKRGLYLEVIREVAGELLQALEPDAERSGPENVRRGVLAYFTFVEARAEAYQALMRGGLHSDPDVARELEGVRQAIVSRIAAGVGIPVLPPAFRVAARSWIGAVEAAALDWLEHRDVSVAALTDLLAAGLFGQLVVASSLAPRSGAKLELSSGLRMLGALMGGAASVAADASRGADTASAAGPDAVEAEGRARTRATPRRKTAARAPR